MQQKQKVTRERTNTGNRGSRKIHLTDGQLVLLGKGLFAKVKSIECKPYMGGAGKIPFDAAQAELNRLAGS